MKDLECDVNHVCRENVELALFCKGEKRRRIIFVSSSYLFVISPLSIHGHGKWGGKLESGVVPLVKLVKWLGENFFRCNPVSSFAPGVKHFMASPGYSVL